MSLMSARGEARPARARWVLPAVVFWVCAAVYAATVSPNPSPDAFTANFASWHIARTGLPVPSIPDFPLLHHNVIRETWIVQTADGREAVGRAPGVIALAVPAYALLRPETVSAVPGGLSAAVLTAAAITLLFVLLRDRIGSRAALTASAIVAFATPVWSVAADAMWPHTLTTLGILGMAWAADRGRWWAVGLFGGLVLWGRLHAAIVCAVLGLGVGLTRRDWRVVARVGLGSGALLAAMCGWTRWMYGEWDPTAGYRAGDFGANVAGNLTDVENYLGFLVAADRGMLWWSPLLVLLAPAVWRNRRELPDWSRWLALGGLTYLLSQAVLNRFSGGDQFYGYRTSLELVVALVPVLALSAHRMLTWERRLFTPLAVYQVVLIAPGSMVDGFYTPVAQVWRHNSFLDALRERPGELLPLALLALVVSLVVVLLLRWAPVVRLLEADAPTPPAGQLRAADSARAPGRTPARSQC